MRRNRGREGDVRRGREIKIHLKSVRKKDKDQLPKISVKMDRMRNMKPYHLRYLGAEVQWSVPGVESGNASMETSLLVVARVLSLH